MSTSTIHFETFAEASAFARSHQGRMRRSQTGLGFEVSFRSSSPATVAVAPSLVERVDEFTHVSHFQLQRTAIGFCKKVRSLGGTAWAKANKAGRWSVLFHDPSGTLTGIPLSGATVVPSEAAAEGTVQVWPAPSPIIQLDGPVVPSEVLAFLDAVAMLPGTLRVGFDEVERQLEVTVRAADERSTTKDSAARQALAASLRGLAEANGIVMRGSGAVLSLALPTPGERRLTWMATIA